MEAPTRPTKHNGQTLIFRISLCALELPAPSLPPTKRSHFPRTMKPLSQPTTYGGGERPSSIPRNQVASYCFVDCAKIMGFLASRCNRGAHNTQTRVEAEFAYLLSYCFYLDFHFHFHFYHSITSKTPTPGLVQDQGPLPLSGAYSDSASSSALKYKI